MDAKPPSRFDMLRPKEPDQAELLKKAVVFSEEDLELRRKIQIAEHADLVQRQADARAAFNLNRTKYVL